MLPTIPDGERAEWITFASTQLTNLIGSANTDDISRMVQFKATSLYAYYLRKLQQLERSTLMENLIRTSPIAEPFFLELDNIQDVRRRVENTIIFVKNNPVVVNSVDTIAPHKFTLNVSDRTGKSHEVLYDKANVDLRTPLPQYIVYNDTAVWMYRSATQQQQQGLTQNNISLKPVGRDSNARMGDRLALLRGLIPLEDCPYDDTIYRLVSVYGAITSLRLSARVAIYRLPDGGVGVEYKGRRLGAANKHVVSVDPVELRPWVVSDFKAVNMELRSL